jgi:hypothetical protein
LLWFLVLLIFNVRAQIPYKLNPASTMTISGTSTIHEWTSKVNTINCDMNLSKDAGEKSVPTSGKFIESLKMEIPVKSIESPRGVVMDNKTYEALKSEEFPLITFLMKNNEISGITDKTTGKFKINITGDLTIAGFTKQVTLPLDGQKIENGSFSFSGDYTFNMSEFNITPPTAMFGQIVTGDKITLAYTFLADKTK